MNLLNNKAKRPAVFTFKAAGLLCLIIIANNSASAQTSSAELQSFAAKEKTINLANPAFTTVLGGNSLTTPKKTEYGYITLTEGRMITAFNKEGTLLWQRGIKEKPQPYLTVAPADLFYTVTSRTNLNMHNSTGLILWTTNTELNICQDPLVGKDGRVFVRDENAISCYGTKGICRWKLETPASDTEIHLTQMNDGSLLLALKELNEGKTKAIRISPFGSILEELTFTGRASAFYPSENGVLITFTDGSIGLCAAEKDSIEQKSYSISKWTLSSKNETYLSDTIVAENTMYSGKTIICSGKSTRLIVLDELTGQCENQFLVENLSTKDILSAETTAQGITLITKNKALCLNTAGEILWQADISQASNWTSVLATDSGNLFFMCNDWTLKGVQIRKIAGTPVSSFKKKEIQSYSQFYNFQDDTPDEFLSAELCEEIYKGFNQGYFGEKEEQWLPFIELQIEKLYSQWMTANSSYLDGKPYYQVNIPANRLVLKMAYASGSTVYQKKIASLLKNIKDPSVLIFLMEAAGECGYDPDLDMLNAMENLVTKGIQVKDTSFQITLCDATYKICRYMGRTAFFEKGQAIISKLIYPAYPQKTRDYAMETMRKILDLRI